MLDPSPSLVEPLVLLVLDKTLAVLESGSRNVDSLSGVSVNQNAGLVERGGVIDWHDIEELTEDVRVELFISEDTLKSNCLTSLGIGLKPEGVILVLLNLEELIAALFPVPKADLTALFVPDEVGAAAHDFKLIITVSYLLNHPKLAEVVGIGSNADDSGFIIALGIVCLDPEGLVSIMADELVDVSSWEL